VKNDSPLKQKKKRRGNEESAAPPAEWTTRWVKKGGDLRVDTGACERLTNKARKKSQRRLGMVNPGRMCQKRGGRKK